MFTRKFCNVTVELYIYKTAIATVYQMLAFI